MVYLKRIELDGNLIKRKGHNYLKKAFNFPNYYGNNLDALYDCLTDISVQTEIRLKNKNSVPYDIMETFRDASDANPFLEFVY